MSLSGGTSAIVLREATRRAGVTPRAAYRHFADHDALVRAVARAALAEMAIAIDRRQVGATGGVALLESVGLGYIQFALDESGWFDVAFFAMGGTVSDVAPDPSRAILTADGRRTACSRRCWPASSRSGFSTPGVPTMQRSCAGLAYMASPPLPHAARSESCRGRSSIGRPANSWRTSSTP